MQHHFETLVARAVESDPLGYGSPEWVERDFRGYLECGNVAHGFEFSAPSPNLPQPARP